jgi:outer membrane protein insertion porin family
VPIAPIAPMAEPAAAAAAAALAPEAPAAEEPEPAQEFDVEAAFAAVRNKPCRVSAVSVSGLERTRPGVVLQELRAVTAARSLEEIKDALVRAHADLMGLGAFEAVEITVDEGEPSAAGGAGGAACRVDARVRERSLLNFHTGTYVQGTQGSVEAAVILNNPTGHAETVQLKVERGTQAAGAFALSATKPRPYGRPLVVDVRLTQESRDHHVWSSYAETARGAAATLSSEDGRHALVGELAWRRLDDASRAASRAVIAQLGHELKASATYIAKAHTFDDLHFPTTGWGARSTTELAGLPGAAAALRFAKQHLVAQLALPAGPSAALSLTAEAGVLLPLGARGLAHGGGSAISDRFFLGGLGGGSLRGFAQRGVGPTDARRPPSAADAAAAAAEGAPLPRGRDALGGDVACSLLAALQFRLPHEGLTAAGVHGQVFLNGGTLCSLQGAASPAAFARDLASSFRWSAGAGVVWATQIGRLELNLCHVLRAGPHDAKRGLQFGFCPLPW